MLSFSSLIIAYKVIDGKKKIKRLEFVMLLTLIIFHHDHNIILSTDTDIVDDRLDDAQDDIVDDILDGKKYYVFNTGINYKA